MTRVCRDCRIEKNSNEFYTWRGNGRRATFSVKRCKDCYRLLRKNKYAKVGYLVKRVSDLKIKYNLTETKYNKLLEKQRGVCAICFVDKVSLNSKRRNWNVDHCHLTGKVRGLLCDNCNQGLGKFKDKTDLLMNAINYLEEKEVGEQ